MISGYFTPIDQINIKTLGQKKAHNTPMRHQIKNHRRGSQGRHQNHGYSVLLIVHRQFSASHLDFILVQCMIVTYGHNAIDQNFVILTQIGNDKIFRENILLNAIQNGPENFIGNTEFSFFHKRLLLQMLTNKNH